MIRNSPFILFAALSLSAALPVTSADAALLSVDWQTAGDGLVTRDTGTGLDWLDLTVTNNISRNYVLTQLGTGGQFAGWRYASADEAVTLWANIGLDLRSLPGSQLPGLDPTVITAANLLGNTFCDYNCVYFPYGASGVTADRMYWPNQEVYAVVGANHIASTEETYYYVPYNVGQTTGAAGLHFGHYLVQNSPAVVPVPAAAWLLVTGFLGIAGFAKRKTHK